MNDSEPSSVIVTGAASGIGLAIAARLLDDGYVVVGVDTNPAPPELHHRRWSIVTGDVADRNTLRAARQAASAQAPLVAAVGCAGITRVASLVDTDDALFDAVTDTNQRGLLWTAAEAVDEWLTTHRAGVLVAISSVHARHAAPDHAVYEMTKAAAEALVRSVAISHGPQGIRAVAIAPGAVRTPALEASLNSAADPTAARTELQAHAPLRRLAEPHEVAAAVAYAISADAGYLTGETITLDGGWSAVLAQRPDNADATRPS